MAGEKLEKGKRGETDYVKLLRELSSPKVAAKKEFLWQEIMAAVADITRKRTKTAEELLVQFLKFKGRIRLGPESDLPGVMSPEDMLKSAAIQTLSKWTGRKYLKLFKGIYATAESPVLSGIAKVHIEKLGAPWRPPFP